MPPIMRANRVMAVAIGSVTTTGITQRRESSG